MSTKSSSSFLKGFHPVPRDPMAYLPGPDSPLPSSASSLRFDDLVVPSSALVEQAKAFLKDELTVPIWNHSLRSFLFGSVVARLYLPAQDIEFDAESFYLACLFHDIGCTEKNVQATKLSFEFWGGLTARQWLLDHSASPDLADSVAEAIFRHTDFNEGSISLNGSLIQYGTLLDNIHLHPHLLPDHLVAEIHEAYPRLEWGGCFASAMQREVDVKPWAHATELRGTKEKAWDKILGNKLEKELK